MSNAKKPGTGATNKRRRELAAAKLERQNARRADRAARRRRRTLVGSALAVLAVVLVAAAVVFWPQSSGEPVASGTDEATPESSSSGSGACDPAPTPPADPESWKAAPAMALEPKTAYTLTLETNCGQIVVETLPAKAPETVNSMLWLAQEGFFDNTTCHRLTTNGLFVLQCGDPTASGTGGPGYSVPDENLPKEKANNYPAGTVAMANSGAGTSGSQFFIVYQDTTLPPGYTIWGKVTEGLDVVKQVAAQGVAGGGDDGTPAEAIGILTAAPDPLLS